MIKRKVSLRTGPRLEIMQVIRRYQVETEPAYDLIDSAGRFYEAAEALAIGSGAELAADYPEGADVLTLTTDGPPYIIGSYTATPRQDSNSADAAGEYRGPLGLGDMSLDNGAARLIVTPQAIHTSPQLRAQGRLEVSDGAPPAQSAAVAEPTRDTLQDHTDRLNELKAAVDALLRIAELTQPAALQTTATEATAAAAAATQAGDITTAAQKTEEATRAAELIPTAQALTSAHIITTASAPLDTMLSDLLKLER